MSATTKASLKKSPSRDLPLSQNAWSVYLLMMYLSSLEIKSKLYRPRRGLNCSVLVCALGLMRVNVTEARDENRQMDSDDHNQKINAPSVQGG